MENKVKYVVLFYRTETSRCPTREFLSSLPLKVRAKISKWIEKLEDAARTCRGHMLISFAEKYMN